jgi:2-polyprenyl-6-methoxyphenol hydroxylase-like FAD-dependent oxidoreductase
MKGKATAPKHILIVGGSAAGWMTANLLAHAWGVMGTKITLLELPQNGGDNAGAESSTPYLRGFFRMLGIAESEWMPACNATFQCGTLFSGWSAQAGFENYFQPFFAKLDLELSRRFIYNCNLRRAGIAADVHPDEFSISAELAAQNRAPIPNKRLQAEPEYAYHYDAALLSRFLQKKALQKGVAHIVDSIVRVERSLLGNISRVHTAQHDKLEADIFVDCSGAESVLLQQTLKESYLPYDNMLNDSVVVLSVPLSDKKKIPSYTSVAALPHGWVWQIPLTDRIEHGYVYSSQFVPAARAEEELRQQLGGVKNSAARHFKLKPGRVREHWRKNCLAVGAAQGCIEPLAGTNLLLVQFTVLDFIEQYQRGKFTDEHRDNFNGFINSIFEGLHNYVMLHYKLNTRDDNVYWRAGRDGAVSDALAAIIGAWDGGGDFDAALEPLIKNQAHKSLSWYWLLAGMGRFPQPLQNPAEGQAVAGTEAHAVCVKGAKLFYDHAAYLKILGTGAGAARYATN